MKTTTRSSIDMARGFTSGIMLKQEYMLLVQGFGTSESFTKARQEEQVQVVVVRQRLSKI